MNADGTGVAKLNSVQKAAISIAVAQADANLVDGADELLQMYSVLSKITTAVRNPDSLETLTTM
jgi:hypothetical protein